MNIISKIGTAPISAVPPKGSDPNSPALQPQTKQHHGSGQVPPSFSTASLSVPGTVDVSTIGNSEAQLRRQALECLVAVLKSLVAWGTTSSSPPEHVTDPMIRSQIEETRRDNVTPDISTDRLSPGGTDPARGPTPELVDDPSKFESAKQKKTTLLEGIKKFNFKPKRVRRILRRGPSHTHNRSQGIDFFIETGFIPNRDPKTIAQFLLETDGLNKAAIGEYLGEG